MANRYYVVNAETGISHNAFDNKKDAERAAAEMTRYHRERFIVQEGPAIVDGKSVKALRAKYRTKAAPAVPDVDAAYADAYRKLRGYLDTGLEGMRRQAWDRLRALGMDLGRVPETREGAEHLLGHLHAFGLTGD